MLISDAMPLDALRLVTGPMTDTELRALLSSLVALHSGTALRDIPPLILAAHINHALRGLPDTIPGEFVR